MQPFAPTPRLSDPIPNPNAISLNEEIKLSTNARERDTNDTLSVIFSLLVSLDFLEKAHVADSVPYVLYRDRCARLMAQYTSLSATVSDDPQFIDLDSFCRRFKLRYPLAVARIKGGSPASSSHVVESSTPGPSVSSTANTTTTTTGREEAASHAAAATAAVVGRQKKGTTAAQVAETVQNFITLMDALKLSFRAKDQLHPLLSDLMSSITQHERDREEEEEEEGEAGDGEAGQVPGKAMIVKWLIRINQMKVSEEISEEEARELFFEVEGLYGEYLKSL